MVCCCDGRLRGRVRFGIGIQVREDAVHEQVLAQFLQNDLM